MRVVAAQRQDDSSVAWIVEAFYSAISWKGQVRPDKEALFALLDNGRALFVHGGDTMDFGQFWHFRVASWVRTAFPFHQREISATTTIYGRMAHRLSVYVGEMADGTAIGRGVNSFQLALDKDGWRIVSVVWEEERDDLPIPDDLV